MNILQGYRREAVMGKPRGYYPCFTYKSDFICLTCGHVLTLLKERVSMKNDKLAR